MNFIKSPKFLIFLIIFVNFLGYGMVFPILPLLTEQYGGDPIISGILIAIFSLMQVVSMPILGKLSDRFGRRPLLIFSLWGTVVSFALMGLTHSIFWLMVARMIDGASGGNISIAQAYMADITDKKHRAGGMGVIAAGITLGFVIGPLWGGLFSGISLSAPFVAATVITLVSVLLTQFFLPESLTRKEIVYEKKHFNFSSVLASLFSPVMFPFYLTFLLLNWSQVGVFATISLFGKDVLKLAVEYTSLLFAAGGIISAFIQMFAIEKIVAKISEEKLFIIGAIIEIIGFGIMAKVNTVLSFAFGMTVFSLGNSLLMPVVQSMVSEKSSQHAQGENLGLLQSFGAVGRIFGPIAAGYIYEKVSPNSPSVMGALIMAVILGIGVKLYSNSRRLQFQKKVV